MTFIHKSIVNQIKDRTLYLLETNGKKKLIFNVVRNCGEPYSENSNGIFFDLRNVSDSTLEKLKIIIKRT